MAWEKEKDGQAHEHIKGAIRLVGLERVEEMVRYFREFGRKYW